MKQRINSLWNHCVFPYVCVTLLTVLTHSWNLHRYPSYIMDEGTYTSQAWWLVHFRQLAPYTYWYDHAPFGWIQIGLWQLITGGPFAFGFSLHSTRIFMVIVALLTNLLLYSTIEKLTRNRILGLTSGLLFALSPLMIISHRLVVLDNLETMWLLLSVWLLLGDDKPMARPLLSGIAFGLAFLSKESAIFFLPVMGYAAYYYSDRGNRSYSLLLWLFGALFLIMLWPLFALLRGELLPAPGFPGDKGHTSFLEATLYQLGRSGGHFWDPGSDFRENLTGWFRQDPFLVTLGLWATILNLLMMRREGDSRVFGLLSLSYLVYLMRGGVVFNFYIIPLLVLFVINIALALRVVMFTTNLALSRGHLVGVFVVISALLLLHYPRLYAADATSEQEASVEYVKEHVPTDSTVVVDNVGWMDLRLESGANELLFPNVEWFWKVDHDPEVRLRKLGNDWRSIKYIVLTFEMLKSMQQFEMPLVRQAYRNSWILRIFTSEGPEQARDAPRQASTDANWTALLAVHQEGVSPAISHPESLGLATAGPWTVSADQPLPWTTWLLTLTATAIALSSSVAVGFKITPISSPTYPLFREWDFELAKDSVFVLMPFASEFRPVYNEVILPTLQELKLEVKRADDFFTTNWILDDIWTAINQAHFNIADLTGRNPNVLYEVGLCHARDKHVILLSQKIEDVPPGLRQRRVVLYNHTPEGREKLRRGLLLTTQTILEEPGWIDMVFTVRRFAPNPKLCFAIFPEHLTTVYKEAIDRAAESVELKCKQIGDVFSTQRIMDDVWDQINRARVIVADVTGRDPDVLYQVGLAHALGKPVILLTQSPDDLPFDLSGFWSRLYVRTEEGLRRLADELVDIFKHITS